MRAESPRKIVWPRKGQRAPPISARYNGLFRGVPFLAASWETPSESRLKKSAFGGEFRPAPRYLTLVNWARFGDFGNFRAAAKGHLQTAPLYRAETATPMNTALLGGARVPPLGASVGQLPAVFWISDFQVEVSHGSVMESLTEADVTSPDTRWRSWRHFRAISHRLTSVRVALVSM
jgi:hypothetical protein